MARSAKKSKKKHFIITIFEIKFSLLEYCRKSECSYYSDVLSFNDSHLGKLSW